MALIKWRTPKSNQRTVPWPGSSAIRRRRLVQTPRTIARLCARTIGKTVIAMPQKTAPRTMPTSADRPICNPVRGGVHEEAGFTEERRLKSEVYQGAPGHLCDQQSADDHAGGSLVENEAAAEVRRPAFRNDVSQPRSIRRDRRVDEVVHRHRHDQTLFAARQIFAPDFPAVAGHSLEGDERSIAAPPRSVPDGPFAPLARQDETDDEEDR